ncbi:DEAD/DEAH box helicase [Candidatus Bathyarchaeota archaeon]|jgi:ATP-dependent RNA helicase DeaD|nr:DEAD/DEAH box helicase [Candidatus Bathyarchaeota archaeon]
MNNFENMGLSPEIVDALDDLGFQRPYPIQEKVIPLLWSGSDIIGQAHTGTGKTAAFGLPILEIVNENNPNVQALIIVPTRELAVQVAEDINSYGKKTNKHALALYGGVSKYVQLEAMRTCPSIVVGTPGRLLDHLDGGSLVLDDVLCVVLDEADRMLEMGFIEDVELIMRSIKGKHQTALFSATIPKSVLKLARRYMNNPREVLIESDDLNVKEIEQYYVTTDSRTKSKSLMKLLNREKIDRAILFCRTKRDTFQINEMLRSRGFSSVVINGNLTQNQRDWAMNKFVNGRRRILVATDLAGRGLDIDGITHIINLDVPQDPYNYFHRIGRTGRAGKKGIAITLVSPEQRSNFKKIQEIGGNTIEKAPELVNTKIAR